MLCAAASLDMYLYSIGCFHRMYKRCCTNGWIAHVSHGILYHKQLTGDSHELVVGFTGAFGMRPPAKSGLRLQVDHTMQERVC